MIKFNYLINWSWLLSIALFIPVNLPAGGSERNSFEPITSQENLPFFANKSTKLRVTPYLEAPVLRRIRVGDSIKVLRIWESPNGENWLHIQIIAKGFSSNKAIRGWIIA